MRNTLLPAAAVLVLAAFLAVGDSTRHSRRDDDLIARTAQGQLKGSIMRTLGNKTIYAFRGVRYAEPPLGELRFKAPVPISSWTGVRNATEDGSACFQPTTDYPVPMSEDCLFLNVYTTKMPRRGSSPNRSVVVFFNPGGFYGFTGHSAVLGPQYLLDHDVILVTCNYRIGVLGLLSTGDNVIPGNHAMKDQVTVLRWVRDNIAAFGGNPDSVTIAGYSAGSISVLMHMVSPMSRGLFHRAIASSGSPFYDWAVASNPRAIARRLAQYFNCSTDTSEAIRSCLLEKDAQQLALAINMFTVAPWQNSIVFAPVLEAEGNDGEQFMTVSPQQQLLAGNFQHVPVITGMTQDEFAWSSLYILRNATWTEEINTDYERIYPLAFAYEQGTENSRYITNELRRFYLNNRDVENTTDNGLGPIYSDAFIGFGVHRQAKILSCLNSKPVYYYKLSYPGRYSWAYLEGTTTPFGVVHHDDLIYVFYISVLFPYFTENDPEVTMVRRLTQLWANFIQTGNPTPVRSELLNNVRWEPLTPTNAKYLEEGTTLEMKQGLFQERMALWDRLFPIQMPRCRGHRKA